MRRGLLALLVMTVATGAAGQGDGGCLRQSELWGGDGPAEHLVVVDGYAFFGGSTLRVADLADPAEPAVVHDLRVESRVLDLERLEDRLLAVDGSAELIVVDATVPYQAAIAGRFVPVSPAWRLEQLAVDHELAVIGGPIGSGGSPTSSGLALLDVGAPTSGPTVLWSTELDGVVERLALGDGAVVATTREGRLLLVDIRIPTAPVLAADRAVSDFLPSGEVHDLAAQGDLLAISDDRGRVVLVDVSDASDPGFLALVQDVGLGPLSLGLDGDRLHGGGSGCTPLGVCGGYVLIDISAPTRPVIVGHLDGPEIGRPSAFGGVAVAPGSRAGLRVVDLGQPAAPQLLEVIIPERVAGPVASAGTLVHVVDTTDLGEPTAPDRNTLRVLRRGPDGALGELGAYRPEGAIWALAGAGDAVAAAVYDEATEFHSVEVVDVADPRRPSRGSRLGARLSVEDATGAPHLAMKGERMALSLEGSDRVLVYEIRAGGRAVQVGDYLPTGDLVSLALVTPELIAVAVRQGEHGWVELVDAAEPPAVHAVGTFFPPAPADLAVSLDGEGARLAVLVHDLDGGVVPSPSTILVDVADPSAPALVSDDLPGGEWVGLGGGYLHTVGDTVPPSGARHTAVNVAGAPDWSEAPSLGSLDIDRRRVDVDGPYLVVGNGRLESHRWGVCGSFPAVLPAEAGAD